MIMVSGIKAGTRGSADIIYPMTDKRFQKGVRIEGFSCGGGIFDTGNRKGILKQFKSIWQAGHRGPGDNLTYKYLFSFSKNELDPDDPRSVDKAVAIVSEIMENLCKNRQWVLVVHKDGKSGLIHVHCITNALHNDLKAAHGRETSYSVIRSVADKTLQKHGIDVDLGENHTKRDKKLQRREHTKQKDKFSWTEYMETMIDKAIDKTTKKSDLDKNLKEVGIGIVEKNRSGWTYRLEKCPETKFEGKTMVYSKFKKDFSNKNINKRVDENYEKLREEQRKAEQIKEREEHIRQIAEGQLSGEDEFLLKIMAERDAKLQAKMDKGLGE